MTNDDHRQAMKARQAAHDRRIFRESLVAMKLDEVFKQPLDQIECVRAIGVTSELHALKRRSLLDGFRLFGGSLCLFYL